MKHLFKRACAMLVALTLAMPVMGTVAAKADEVPTLSDKKLTIDVDGEATISVENSVEGANYVFKSTNKKVVSVKKDGTMAYVTGVSAGTAKIKVKQKLNGETTLVGKCKVKVKGAAVEPINIDWSVQVGWEAFLPGSDFGLGAKYFELKDDGVLEDIGMDYKGDGFVYPKKEGTTTVKVWEYDENTGKKGQFLGTITVTAEYVEY